MLRLAQNVVLHAHGGDIVVMLRRLDFHDHPFYLYIVQYTAYIKFGAYQARFIAVPFETAAWCMRESEAGH